MNSKHSHLKAVICFATCHKGKLLKTIGKIALSLNCDDFLIYEIITFGLIDVYVVDIKAHPSIYMNCLYQGCRKG